MKKTTLTVLFPVLSILLLFMTENGMAITCPQLDISLAPCLPYLMTGGMPAVSCCDGVRNVKTMTPTTADRQAACRCMKDAAARYHGIRPELAMQLPVKCSVDFGVPITTDVDCDRIK